MQYQRLDSPQAFYAMAEAYLLRHEAANNLLIGLTHNLSRRPQVYGTEPPYFGIVREDTDEGKIVGVALRTPLRSLILSHIEDREALHFIAQDVQEIYPSLPAVMGRKEDSRQFAERWALLSGQQVTPGMFQRIYSAAHIIPPADVPGAARPADENDRPLLRQWMHGFNQDAFAHQPPMSDEQFEAWVNIRLNTDLGGVYLWEDEAGQPVSMAGYTGFTPNGVRIGPVYTPPQSRGHGYGSAVTAAVSQMLLDSGRRFCYLFTDLSNPTSNRIYQNIGYEAVCDTDEYRFA